MVRVISKSEKEEVVDILEGARIELDEDLHVIVYKIREEPIDSLTYGFYLKPSKQDLVIYKLQNRDFYIWMRINYSEINLVVRSLNISINLVHSGVNKSCIVKDTIHYYSHFMLNRKFSWEDKEVSAVDIPVRK